MKPHTPIARGLLAVVALLASLAPATAGLIGNTFDGRIFSVDTTTGAASFLSTTTATSLVGIAFQPGTGDLFGLTSLVGTPANSLVKINPTTGATTLVGGTGLSNIGEGDLTFNPLTGSLYGASANPTPLGPHDYFQLDPLTGAGTVLSSHSVTFDYSAIAFDLSGGLFAIETNGANSTLHLLNPANGGFGSTIPMNVNLGAVAGMAFDPVTGTAYVADGDAGGTNTLYTLNTTTGVLTSVGSLNLVGGLAGLSFSPVGPAPAVPEPGTALAGAMMLGLCGARRRRSRAA